MECLICYKVYFNHPESSPNDFDISLTISKLFDISPSWFTEIDTFNPLSICPDCYEKLRQVHRMLKELEQIQINLKRIKTEVFEDLRKSEELSQKNGVELKERTKIVQEICSRSKQNVDKSYPINSDTGTLSDVKMFATEYSDECIKAILDYDHNHDQVEIDSIDNDNEDLIQPNPVPTLKNLQIILEPLPIQHPFTNGDSFNIKDQAISNFRRRDRSKIKMRKRLEKKKTRTDANCKLKKGRKLKKIKLAQSQTKSKEKSNLVPNDEKPAKKIIHGLIKHCDICNITFRGHTRYMAHHRRVHTGERPFQCDKCPKNFFCEWHLTAHLKTHGIGHGVLQCSICSKFCKYQTDLDNHMNGVHFQIKLWFCDSCPRSFGSKKTLEEHVMSFHIGQKFKCPNTDCKKTFNTTSGLSYHVKSIHEKAFRFFCPVENCDKAFLQEADLKAHNERTHLKIKKFSCDKCPDKNFYKKTSLDEHYLANHADESEKKIRCKYCDKSFAATTKLKRHLKLHTGIRDQICDICGEAYAVKSSLDSHIANKHLGMDKNLIADITKRRKGDRRIRVPIIPNIPIEELNVIRNGPS